MNKQEFIALAIQQAQEERLKGKGRDAHYFYALESFLQDLGLDRCEECGDYAACKDSGSSGFICENCWNGDCLVGDTEQPKRLGEW